MQDDYTGQAGTFIIDLQAGIRVPAEDWELYQFDKTAYLADRDAALAAFNKPAKKAVKQATEGVI